MIIQIRGTSGSGKSTVMKKVMDAISKKWKAVYKEGRKKPLYYEHENIVIIGHYESPCGGGDTIGSARQIYELIGQFSSDKIILVEGLLLSEDTKWTSQYSNTKIIFLVTSLNNCILRIQGRRFKAGNNKPLNTSNTENRVAVIERARVKLEQIPITCKRCSDRQAVKIITKWIKES